MSVGEVLRGHFFGLILEILLQPLLAQWRSPALAHTERESTEHSRRMLRGFLSYLERVTAWGAGSRKEKHTKVSEACLALPHTQLRCPDSLMWVQPWLRDGAEGTQGAQGPGTLCK